MATRRKYKLTDKFHRDTVDLMLYSQDIIDTINVTVPNKNPVVYQDYFATDPLTQKEAVAIGRALSKLPQLSQYGKTITTFRLFDGRAYESGPTPAPVNQPKTKSKGGRLQ